MPVEGAAWCRLKKKHNLKVENYVLFGGHTEDVSPGDSLSDSSEGLFWTGKGTATIYRSCCKTKTKTKQNKKPR